MIIAGRSDGSVQLSLRTVLDEVPAAVSLLHLLNTGHKAFAMANRSTDSMDRQNGDDTWSRLATCSMSVWLTPG